MILEELMDLTDRKQRVIIGTKDQLEKHESAFAGSVDDYFATPDDAMGGIMGKEVRGIRQRTFEASKTIYLEVEVE